MSESKPTYQKLGYTEGIKAYLYDEPDNYHDYLGIPFDVNFDSIEKSMYYDLVHVFVTSINDLKKHESELHKLMNRDGMLWVSWPKGDKYINRDMIRQFMLTRDLVDVKVASFDEKWSCLKFVVPVHLR